MAVHHRGHSLTDLRSKPSETVQRRRRRQSIKIQRNIDDDVVMASTIGDVTWLQQSLYDTRQAYSVSKEHVSDYIKRSRKSLLIEMTSGMGKENSPECPNMSCFSLVCAFDV